MEKKKKKSVIYLVGYFNKICISVNRLNSLEINYL